MSLAAGSLCYQLILPPIVGFANNGDFAKIIGRFDLYGRNTRQGDFIDATYYFHPERHWVSDFWSSEILLVLPAIGLNTLLSKDGSFDLRWMGVVHGGLFLAALWLMAPLFENQRRAVRIGIYGLMLLAFCDVMYVCGMNSFYMDTAAYVFLLLTVATYLRVLQGQHPRDMVLFAICAVLLVTSKIQHALLGFWIAGLLAAGPPRTLRRLAPCLALLAALMIWKGAPRSYPLDQAYNITFTQILPHSRDVTRTLADLGLDESYRAHIGTNCFARESRMDDAGFRAELARHLSVPKLVGFFITHPRDTWEALDGILAEAGRQRLFGNFDASAGLAPGAESQAFAWWSNAKRACFFHHGSLILAAFLGVAGALCFLLVGARKELPAGTVAAGFALAGMAITELVGSALGDPLDQPRHHVVSFALFDMMVVATTCLAVRGRRFAPASAKARPDRWRRLQPVAGVGALLLVGVYYFRLARPCLHLYFSPDDVMNLHCAWTWPRVALVKANLLFFLNSPFGRPLGALWYRTIFHFAGFHPLPFHAAGLVLVWLNIALTYALARGLSGSRTVAAVTALLFSYTPRMAAIYFDTGFIFDVLCYCFYAAALLLYVRVRAPGRWLGGWQIAAFFGLYICALNSKEMAITLPLIVGVYEWVFHPPVSLGKAGILRWVRRQGRWAAVSGAMTAMFVIGRASGPDSAIRNAAYTPVFTWTRFMETSCHFLGDAPAVLVLAGWGGLFAVAWLAKSRPLLFAAWFIVLSPLPVAFVPPRGAPQYYVCWFGWTLYAALLSAWAVRYLTEPVEGGRHWVVAMRNATLFLAPLAMLYPQYKRYGWADVTSVSLEAPQNRTYVEQLHGLERNLRPGSRILFLNDPIRPDWWNMHFLVRLSYRDRSLAIDRVKQHTAAADRNSYDYIFDYRDGRFVEVKRPGP